MKATLSKILAASLAALMIIPAFVSADEVPGITAPDDANYGTMLISLDEEEESDKTVYVSQNGSDEIGDGKTPETALGSLQAGLYQLGLDGGTVVLMGEVPLGEKAVSWPAKKTEGMKRVTITGYDDEAVLLWNRSLNPDGDLTLEYLNIRIDKEWAYLNARGYDLVLGKGLVMSIKQAAEGETQMSTYFPIRGGGDTGNGIEGDTRITIYSGTYGAVCLGSRNASVTGNAYLTIHGGRFPGGITVGGEMGNDTKQDVKIMGDVYVTITGGNVDKITIPTNTTKDGTFSRGVDGKKILDVSKYVDAKPNWFGAFDEVKEYDSNLVEVKPEMLEAKAEGSYINGYPEADGTFSFKPQNTITRAEAITIISRLLAKDADIKGKYTSKYTDLAGHWATDNIAYLESLGVLDTLEERGAAILPNEPITRMEVCELIAAIGDFAAMKLVHFTDLGIRDNREAIYKLASEGIITGYANGDGTFSFKPADTITRAEFVTIVNRFIGRTANAENAANHTKFADIAGHWAFGNIVASATDSTLDGKEMWTQTKEKAAFVLPEEAKTAQDYIKALKAQSETLTTTAITDAIEVLTQKRIEEIRNTATTVEVTGKKYYVSAEGNDSNDGLSPNTAWKTIDKVSSAALRSGDGVFFRRGDIFAGQLTAKSGVTYSAYGEGAKPRLYYLELNAADKSLWEATEVAGIYKLTKKQYDDIGNIVFDGISNARKIYRSVESDGKFLDYYTKREFNTWKDLIDDLSFYHDADGTVYIKSDKGNPGELYKEIRLVPRQAIVRCGNNSCITVDNLHIAYGNFGISANPTSDGLTVQNCEFNWIGGCIQSGPLQYSATRTFPTPYGNGIEIYGQAQNFTVDNCYFWQIYDAAMTHQGSRNGNVACENIHYTNNVVEKAVYAVEIFYGNSDNAADIRSFNGTYIENNILRKGGGFGHYARPDGGVTALIRNGILMDNTTNYIVKNNILDRSETRIIMASADGGSKAMYYDNIYVQAKEAEFARRNGKLFVADALIAEELARTGTEHNSTYIIVDELGYGKDN